MIDEECAARKLHELGDRILIASAELSLLQEEYMRLAENLAAELLITSTTRRK